MEIRKLIEMLERAEKECPNSVVCLFDDYMREFPVATISYNDRQTFIYHQDEPFK